MSGSFDELWQRAYHWRPGRDFPLPPLMGRRKLPNYLVLSSPSETILNELC
jgi:hypothetical protein